MSEKKMRAMLEKVQYQIEDYDLAMEARAALAEPVVDDFQRGAEAMREAAARCATERSRYWTETSHAEGGVTTMEDRAEEARYIAEDIRDLPALDDK